MPTGSRSEQSGARGGYAGGPVSGIQAVVPVFNSKRSEEKEKDWTIVQAIKEGIIKDTYPENCDLRDKEWYHIVSQRHTGSCTGWASTDSVLRWHYIKAGKLDKKLSLSARFTWMAAKETDKFVDFPETFIEKSGTPLKAALNVLKKFGCLLEEDFPFNGSMIENNTVEAVYTKAAQFRIKSYYSLIIDEKPIPGHLRMWLSQQGPILVLSDLDSSFLNLYDGKTKLDQYDKESVKKDCGHAFALVGYTKDHFIIRNTWGTDWGEMGYAYATEDYIINAICEGYGVCI